MKLNLFRLLLIFNTSFVLFSTPLVAKDLETSLVKLEEQMQQVRTQTAMGTSGLKTASARPEVSGCGWAFFFNALCLSSKLSGTEFALNYLLQSNAFYKGKLEDVDTNWKWGGQLKAGYNQLKDHWDIELGYGWYDSKGNTSIYNQSDNFIFPLRFSSEILNTNLALNDTKGAPTVKADLPPTFCKSAKSEVALHHKRVSLDLGRAYFLSDSLAFRPHWGVEAASINHSQTIRYIGDGSILLGNNTIHIKDDCKLQTVGIGAGLDSKWYLSASGVHLFCNLNGSLPYGSFSIHHHEKFSGNPTHPIDLNFHDHAFCPTAEIKIGLGYASYIQKHTQHLRAEIGFKTLYQNNVNKTFRPNFPSDPKFNLATHDTTTYGFNIEFKWSF